MSRDESDIQTDLNHPDPDEEKQFLVGSRDNPSELATAGRVFLEFVRGFKNLGGLGMVQPARERSYEPGRSRQVRDRFWLRALHGRSSLLSIGA